MYTLASKGESTPRTQIGEFQFDRVITGWRDRPVLDLRLKR